MCAVLALELAVPQPTTRYLLLAVSPLQNDRQEQEQYGWLKPKGRVIIEVTSDQQEM